jgi:DnaK suppressor protein
VPRPGPIRVDIRSPTTGNDAELDPKRLTPRQLETIFSGYFSAGFTLIRHGVQMEGTGLKKKDLKRFRDILLAKKKEILRNAQRTLNEDMTLDADDLPDEMDLASSEYLHSFTFRLRGREKGFLSKIDHALEKIREGTFGTCEQCGEAISMKRLEARLETTLCIRCKEDQERIEKAYG